jgi:hypothetical protein
MGKININEIIPSARHLINSFIENLDPTLTHLPDNVVQADAFLARLHALHEEFHGKVERFGPPAPHKFLGGHEWSIQQRCFGDGVNPENCGRWFIKVSALHYITLSAGIDLE